MSPSKKKQDKMAKLRGILSKKPSQKRFGTILKLVQSWRDDDERAVVLAYLETHLESWPDEYRRATMQQCWPTFPSGEPLQNFSLVREFDLFGEWMGPECVKLLVNSEHIKHLTALDIGANGIYDAGALTFANSNLHNITDLDLSDNGLTDKGVIALANSEHLAHLNVLRFGEENKISAKGYKALILSKHLAPIVKLPYLKNCEESLCVEIANELELPEYPNMSAEEQCEVITAHIGNS